jgi:hypothetical protein
MNDMQKKMRIAMLSLVVALLLPMLVCRVAAAAPPSGLLFSSAYGGDPGRDEIMFTADDLDYMNVVTKVAASKISVLTVDCQTSFIGDYAIDAHNNFEYIATQTGGVHYDYTTLWNTIRDEIKSRIGSGKGDIVFVFDLTGSMSWIRPQLKTEAKNIIDGLTGDVAFGVGTHVDYPGFYDSYGYANWYGASPDYAWKLDQDITKDTTAAKNVIGALGDYGGADGPQDYARALYETQFCSWRPKAARIVVMFGDAPPHSAPGGLARTTGGGWIGSGSDSFGFTVKMEPTGPKGELQYVDHDLGYIVHSVSIKYLLFERASGGAYASFGGSCTVNGVEGYTFDVFVWDMGEPGAGVDYFRIWIPELGYWANGLLAGGNIQIRGP